MESTISNFYANELFIFDPTNKHFYAHEEFLYQFGSSQNHATLNLSNDYLALLNNTKPAQISESENIILESKEKTSYFDKEEEKDENGNLESGKDLNADLFEQNPDLQKHNFDIFLEIVDLTQYTNKVSFQEFFRLYYTWLGDQKYKLAAYSYFRRKGYEIESGCTFSFDYLLYKEGKNEIGLLNKTDRIHSEYGVYLVYEDLKQKITFKDLHRKHRIAHNYSKNLIVCNLKRKNVEDILQEELSIDKVLDQFLIADMMYARSQLHIKTKNKK